MEVRGHLGALVGADALAALLARARSRAARATARRSSPSPPRITATARRPCPTARNAPWVARNAPTPATTSAPPTTTRSDRRRVGRARRRRGAPARPARGGRARRSTRRSGARSGRRSGRCPSPRARSARGARRRTRARSTSRAAARRASTAPSASTCTRSLRERSRRVRRRPVAAVGREEQPAGGVEHDPGAAREREHDEGEPHEVRLDVEVVAEATGHPGDELVPGPTGQRRAGGGRRTGGVLHVRLLESAARVARTARGTGPDDRAPRHESASGSTPDRSRVALGVAVGEIPDGARRGRPRMIASMDAPPIEPPLDPTTPDPRSRPPPAASAPRAGWCAASTSACWVEWRAGWPSTSASTSCWCASASS